MKINYWLFAIILSFNMEIFFAIREIISALFPNAPFEVTEFFTSASLDGYIYFTLAWLILTIFAFKFNGKKQGFYAMLGLLPVSFHYFIIWLFYSR